jgi:hypothetical protein
MDQYGKDIIFLDGNDMRQYSQDPSDTSVTGRTAFIMVSSDAATGPPPAGFTTFNYIESRNTGGRNLP